MRKEICQNYSVKEKIKHHKLYKRFLDLPLSRAGSSAWLEHRAFNPVVSGSNPDRPAIGYSPVV